MGYALPDQGSFHTIECCNCGIHFGLPDALYRSLCRSHNFFFCPNGHEQHFIGESEEEKLKKQVKAYKQEAEWNRERADRNWKRAEAADRSRAAHQGVATKRKKEHDRMKNRVQHGVCPCCNRSFQNLRRHMETQHMEEK